MVVHKLPVLAVYFVESISGTKELARESVLTQEKAKLFISKILIFLAQRIIFLLHLLARIIEQASERTRQFYHRQKRKEDFHEDVVKKQEEISKNSDYWRIIRYGLRSRKKKDKKSMPS